MLFKTIPIAIKNIPDKNIEELIISVGNLGTTPVCKNSV